MAFAMSTFFDAYSTQSDIHTALNINTDSMNLVQYVNHLYQTNDNSFDVVCQILRTHGYHVGCPNCGCMSLSKLPRS